MLMTFAPNIRFGKWERLLFYMDENYDNLISKLIQFAREAGPDPCGRHFDAEPLVDFAVTSECWRGSADYIYQKYTYHLIRQHEDVDDIDLLLAEFFLLPEN